MKTRSILWIFCFQALVLPVVRADSPVRLSFACDQGHAKSSEGSIRVHESSFPERKGTVRIADGKLQVGLDPARGTLRELIRLPDDPNQLADTPAPLGLWQMTVDEGGTSSEVSADRAGPPQVERLAGDPPGLRLVWDKVSADGREPLRVEVVVRLGHQDAPLSRWEMSVAKPRSMWLKQVRFPRVPSLRLPIDVHAYRLPARCAVYRIDHTGRKRLGQFDARDPVWQLELPPRALCLIEFCRQDG